MGQGAIWTVLSRKKYAPASTRVHSDLLQEETHVQSADGTEKKTYHKKDRKALSANYHEPNRYKLPAQSYTHYYPSTIFSAIRERKTIHPTQKPVSLLEWLVRTYSNPGDTVLDPVFGSCTTGVACVKNSRNFIGIEKDPTYFAIGEKRLKEAMQ